MKNFTGFDSTQVEICRHLAVTEQLLARAVSKLSGTEQQADIWAMPDLGLPHSINRIFGGFFTGAVYTWSSTVPFVPVDATVNSCGVAMFRTDRDISSQAQFESLVKHARQLADETCYQWNYDEGNHFITLTECSEDGVLPRGRYLILHSSACEFKHGPQGLYPDHNAWFANSIQTLDAPDQNRHLRYISGRTAERFCQRAQMLEDFNRVRQEFFATAILGSRHCLEEVLNIPHYGMPSPDSVSIGCQWLDLHRRCLLLTAPGAPLYLLKPSATGANRIRLQGQEYVLQPHGLGVSHRKELALQYAPGAVEMNGRRFALGESLKLNSDVFIRGTAAESAESFVARFSEQCPAQVEATLRPIFTYPTKSIN